jgi:hypothetical protein
MLLHLSSLLIFDFHCSAEGNSKLENLHSRQIYGSPPCVYYFVQY